MANFFEMFFGPLDEKWCNILLALAVIQFAFLVSVVFGIIVAVLTGFGKIQFRDIINMIFAILIVAYGYIMARLQYRICTAAL
jgi:type IV secretory pathway VirB2 component (pilin)